MNKEYTHGGDVYSIEDKNIIDFSANINPLGLPKAVEEAVIESVEKWNTYPDPFCRRLVSKISAFEGVDEDCIICGNGAADIIFKLAKVGLREAVNKRVLVTAPTFSEYEKALVDEGFAVDHFMLFEDEGFKLTDRILQEDFKIYDMIFICNPNNPTGTMAPKSLMIDVAAKACEAGTLLVVDECFISFAKTGKASSLVDKLKEYRNLIILKAFTKNFAMAGFRLGYGLTANSRLQEALFAAGQPWGVSWPAQVAGETALDCQDYLENSKMLIWKEHDKLTKALINRGFKVFESVANYICFKVPDGIDGRHMREGLQERGFLTRDCGNYVGLDNRFTRIAVRLPDENRGLIEAMDDYLREVKHG